jgi:hypothetical protein
MCLVMTHSRVIPAVVLDFPFPGCSRAIEKERVGQSLGANETQSEEIDSPPTEKSGGIVQTKNLEGYIPINTLEPRGY